MPFRILQYVVLAWDAYLRDHPKASTLPLIVPLVFHQGPGAWDAPRDLLGMIDLTADEAAVLGRYVPRIGFELDDLGRTSDADLLARRMTPEATLALSALRDVRIADDVPALLGHWAELLRAASATPSGLRALTTVLRYILEVHRGLDVQELAPVVDAILSGAGAAVMTTVQQYIEMGKAEGRIEGKAEGRIEGKAEGRIEGRRATVLHLLRLKFHDAVTPEVAARIESADEDALVQLERWILTARTVDELP